MNVQEILKPVGKKFILNRLYVWRKQPLRNGVWQLEGLQTEQLPVKITVNTTIQDGTEKETYELITFGYYVKKTKSVFLRYEEFLEEGTINTIVKISGQRRIDFTNRSRKDANPV